MQFKSVKIRKQASLSSDSDTALDDCKKFYNNFLIFCIIIAIIIGLILGMVLRNEWRGDHDLKKIFYLQFPGLLLLNMLKMLLIPLIISTLISGMTNFVIPETGRTVASVIVYHLATACLAFAAGFAVMLALSPQVAYDKQTQTKPKRLTFDNQVIALLDLFSQCFPENLITACFERVVTEFVKVKTEPKFLKMKNTTYSREVMKVRYVARRGTNVLGLVVISLACGYIINQLQKQGRPLKKFFNSLNSVCMVILNISVWYTPICLIFLIASKTIVTTNIQDTMANLGKYLCLILGSLAFHGFIDLSMIYFLLTGKSPKRFASTVSTALFTSWGTDSSSTAIPITIKCLIENSKLDESIVHFMVPLSTAFNFDGTMLYEALSCIFLAKLSGLRLQFMDIIIVSLTSAATSIGVNTLPQSGMMTTFGVLTVMGFPTEHITLIMSVDWLVDRFRTVVNVWGTCVCTAIIHHFSEDIIRQNAGSFDEEIAERQSVFSGSSVSSITGATVFNVHRSLSDRSKTTANY